MKFWTKAKLWLPLLIPVSAIATTAGVLVNQNNINNNLNDVSSIKQNIESKVVTSSTSEAMTAVDYSLSQYNKFSNSPVNLEKWKRMYGDSSVLNIVQGDNVKSLDVLVSKITSSSYEQNDALTYSTKIISLDFSSYSSNELTGFQIQSVDFAGGTYSQYTKKFVICASLKVSKGTTNLQVPIALVVDESFILSAQENAVISVGSDQNIKTTLLKTNSGNFLCTNNVTDRTVQYRVIEFQKPNDAKLPAGVASSFLFHKYDSENGLNSRDFLGLKPTNVKDPSQSIGLTSDQVVSGTKFATNVVQTCVDIQTDNTIKPNASLLYSEKYSNYFDSRAHGRWDNRIFMVTPFYSKVGHAMAIIGKVESWVQDPNFIELVDFDLSSYPLVSGGGDGDYYSDNKRFLFGYDEINNNGSVAANEPSMIDDVDVINFTSENQTEHNTVNSYYQLEGSGQIVYSQKDSNNFIFSYPVYSANGQSAIFNLPIMLSANGTSSKLAGNDYISEGKYRGKSTAGWSYIFKNTNNPSNVLNFAMKSYKIDQKNKRAYFWTNKLQYPSWTNPYNEQNPLLFALDLSNSTNTALNLFNYTFPSDNNFAEFDHCFTNAIDKTCGDNFVLANSSCEYTAANKEKYYPDLFISNQGNKTSVNTILLGKKVSNGTKNYLTNPQPFIMNNNSSVGNEPKNVILDSTLSNISSTDVINNSTNLQTVKNKIKAKFSYNISGQDAFFIVPANNKGQRDGINSFSGTVANQIQVWEKTMNDSFSNMTITLKQNTNDKSHPGSLIFTINPSNMNVLSSEDLKPIKNKGLYCDQYGNYSFIITGFKDSLTTAQNVSASTPIQSYNAVQISEEFKHNSAGSKINELKKWIENNKAGIFKALPTNATVSAINNVQLSNSTTLSVTVTLSEAFTNNGLEKNKQFTFQIKNFSTTFNPTSLNINNMTYSEQIFKDIFGQTDKAFFVDWQQNKTTYEKKLKDYINNNNQFTNPLATSSVSNCAFTFNSDGQTVSVTIAFSGMNANGALDNNMTQQITITLKSITEANNAITAELKKDIETWITQHQNVMPSESELKTIITDCLNKPAVKDKLPDSAIPGNQFNTTNINLDPTKIVVNTPITNPAKITLQPGAISTTGTTTPLENNEIILNNAKITITKNISAKPPVDNYSAIQITNAFNNDKSGQINTDVTTFIKTYISSIFDNTLPPNATAEIIKIESVTGDNSQVKVTVRVNQYYDKTGLVNSNQEFTFNITNLNIGVQTALNINNMTYSEQIFKDIFGQTDKAFFVDWQQNKTTYENKLKDYIHKQKETIFTNPLTNVTDVISCSFDFSNPDGQTVSATITFSGIDASGNQSSNLTKTITITLKPTSEITGIVDKGLKDAIQNAINSNNSEMISGTKLNEVVATYLDSIKNDLPSASIPSGGFNGNTVSVDPTKISVDESQNPPKIIIAKDAIKVTGTNVPITNSSVQLDAKITKAADSIQATNDPISANSAAEIVSAFTSDPNGTIMNGVNAFINNNKNQIFNNTLPNQATLQIKNIKPNPADSTSVIVTVVPSDIYGATGLEPNQANKEFSFKINNLNQGQETTLNINNMIYTDQIFKDIFGQNDKAFFDDWQQNKTKYEDALKNYINTNAQKYFLNKLPNSEVISCSFDFSNQDGKTVSATITFSGADQNGNPSSSLTKTITITLKTLADISNIIDSGLKQAIQDATKQNNNVLPTDEELKKVVSDYLNSIKNSLPDSKIPATGSFVPSDITIGNIDRTKDPIVIDKGCISTNTGISNMTPITVDKFVQKVTSIKYDGSINNQTGSICQWVKDFFNNNFPNNYYDFEDQNKTNQTSLTTKLQTFIDTNIKEIIDPVVSGANVASVIIFSKPLDMTNPVVDINFNYANCNFSLSLLLKSKEVVKQELSSSIQTSLDEVVKSPNFASLKKEAQKNEIQNKILSNLQKNQNLPQVFQPLSLNDIHIDDQKFKFENGSLKMEVGCISVVKSNNTIDFGEFSTIPPVSYNDTKWWIWLVVGASAGILLTIIFIIIAFIVRKKRTRDSLVESFM